MFRRLLVALALVATSAWGQDRLPSYPGYERYREVSSKVWGSVKRGDLTTYWVDGGKGLVYAKSGKRLRLDTGSLEETEWKGEWPPARPARQGRRGGPARGRQFAEETSPDGKWVAFYRNRNVWIRNADGSGEFQATQEGNAATRIKFGQASWVYGEELGQNQAMGWSPDGTKLWLYRFDESPVTDFPLAVGLTNQYSKVEWEAYPKAGTPNPVVQLWVFDLAKRSLVQVATKPEGAGPDDQGCYVYGIRWSPFDGSLLFHRTDRLHRTMEFCAADPSLGTVRVMVRESQPLTWTDNQPPRQYLAENAEIGSKPELKASAIWISERNGFRNLYLADLANATMVPITQHSFDVESLVRVDLKAGWVWYLARSSHPHSMQLHRCKMDGSSDRRLTDPAFHHSVNVAPDGLHFVDVKETVDTPPTTRLVSVARGHRLTLATSDTLAFHTLGLKRTEEIRFVAADGRTPLYGRLAFPSNFDPRKKYPLLVDVYAGPESGGDVARFGLPPAMAELGFLVASFQSRGGLGRGKAFKDAVYGNLGVVEIDDQAAGVKHLRQRPYVDGTRVGIHGTSYGGYAAAMALLRHPEVFHAAVASSSVTDWKNYDTIYTERYMGTPQTNPKGYEAGSAMTYASALKGRLLLVYGTADDNVHPNNSHQLVRALMRAGKRFDELAIPDAGHTGVSEARMLEHFLEAFAPTVRAR